MRVSAGFFVYGLSGKMLIQTLPPRLILRVMATRAASIWRLVIQPRSSAFRPYSPKLTSLPPFVIAAAASAHLLAVLDALRGQH